MLGVVETVWSGVRHWGAEYVSRDPEITLLWQSQTDMYCLRKHQTRRQVTAMTFLLSIHHVLGQECAQTSYTTLFERCVMRVTTWVPPVWKKSERLSV